MEKDEDFFLNESTLFEKLRRSINHVKTSYLDNLSNGVTNLRSTGLDVEIPFQDSAEMATVGKAKVGRVVITILYRLVSWVQKDYGVQDHVRSKFIDEMNQEKEKAVQQAISDTRLEVMREREEEKKADLSPLQTSLQDL